MRWAVGWPFTLLAGPEENSSDWGQSPGGVEERPPPHPCSWTFCPGSRSGGGLEGGASRVGSQAPLGSCVLRWAMAGDRAVLAGALLGPAGGAGIAGRGAGPSPFSLPGHRSGHQSVGPATRRDWDPRDRPHRRLTPPAAGPRGGVLRAPAQSVPALPHELCDFLPLSLGFLVCKMEGRMLEQVGGGGWHCCVPPSCIRRGALGPRPLLGGGVGL